ncbi:MAG: nitrate reductase molybdenum cofactor assembly chaperone [Pseudomonadota bacterium]
MKNNRYSLRVLSKLLSYPDADLRAQLPALLPALAEEGALSAARQAELQTLVTHLMRLDTMDAEARYVETFDRGRATCLHLFEHVHGDSRDRGPAMIDLSQTYAQSGLFLSPDELPDHLCVVLEFASTQTPEVAKAFLGEMAHILNAIFSALLQRESPYAVVLAAVLELAGHKAQAVQIVADEALDASWSEPEAFDGCSTRGQARPGEAQPIHIVRKTSTQTRGVAA